MLAFCFANIELTHFHLDAFHLQRYCTSEFYAVLQYSKTPIELLGDRIYFTKSRFSLNGGFIVYMELLLRHAKIITKSRISLNAGTLNRGFTV
jgi:hypothetical protein